MKLRASHVGRLRIKVAEILNENFPDWHVEPEDIRPIQGRYRVDKNYDVYRWELYARRRKPDGTPNLNVPVICGCWQTLTEFARLATKYGCHEREGEIYAGEKE